MRSFIDFYLAFNRCSLGTLKAEQMLVLPPIISFGDGPALVCRAVFKTVEGQIRLSQVGSIPTHPRN